MLPAQINFPQPLQVHSAESELEFGVFCLLAAHQLDYRSPVLLETAAEIFTDVLESQPAHSEANLWLAYLLLLLHQPHRARYHLEQTLKLQPQDAWALALKNCLDSTQISANPARQFAAEAEQMVQFPDTTATLPKEQQ